MNAQPSRPIATFARLGLALALGLSGLAASGAWAQAAATPIWPAVAGLAPDERPEGAPVVAAAPADAALKRARLSGISQPWPGNTERIAEQGAWFSPMFRPGMTGRYDLRGLHSARP